MIPIEQFIGGFALLFIIYGIFASLASWFNWGSEVRSGRSFFRGTLAVSSFVLFILAWFFIVIYIPTALKTTTYLWILFPSTFLLFLAFAFILDLIRGKK